jgi:hypothetical protein
MSYFNKPKSWGTLLAYNLNNKLIVTINLSFVFSRYSLWLELLRCSFSAIDRAGESLSSHSIFIGFRFKCQFKDSILPSPHVLCKSDGVPLLSMYYSSFFYFILLLYFELQKLVPPFLFFRFFRGSIVEFVMCSSSFMCASLFFNPLLALATSNAKILFAITSNVLTAPPWSMILISTASKRSPFLLVVPSLWAPL